MDFSWSPEHEELRATLRRFAEAELAPRYLSDEAEARFPRDLLAPLAELGVLGMRIPERYGGSEADFVSAGIASEEICRAHLGVGYLALIPVLVSEIVAGSASAAQRERMLPPIASGQAVPALCLSEPGHGSDAAHLTLRAERDGPGWRLFGEKTSISLGMDADVALVFARTGGEGARGVSAFFVELDESHLERSAFNDHGSRSIGRASLFFEGHPVPEGGLLGKEGEGFIRVMQGFDVSRAMIGLMCLGAAQASLEEARAYAQERRTMGKPISAHQAVAFPLVEYETYLRAARLLSYEALWRRDQGMPHALEANMVKWWVPKLAVEAAHLALLTTGHTGYSDELPHGQRLRDIIGLEIGDGTAQIAKLVAARHLFGRGSAP
jgi:cyclohexanecarboxyl-CoA dehydrogenase